MKTSIVSYTYYLPFNIEIGIKDPNSNIKISSKDGEYAIIIHPPEAKYIEYGERLDGTEIKIEVEAKDGVVKTEEMYDIASEQLRRLLTYCRYETGQYYINPRQNECLYRRNSGKWGTNAFLHFR